jgi:hypothetical protein
MRAEGRDKGNSCKEYNSVSSFAPVPDRKYYDFISVVVIQRDIGPVSKVNHPLPELQGHFFDRTANLRVFPQRFYALPDGFNGTLGGVPAFGS